MDLEAPLYISELNSAIVYLSLKNTIALFSSEMFRGASKSTSHPKTMMYSHDSSVLLILKLEDCRDLYEKCEE